jgi:hypothetical protein
MIMAGPRDQADLDNGPRSTKPGTMRNAERADRWITGEAIPDLKDSGPIPAG